MNTEVVRKLSSISEFTTFSSYFVRNQASSSSIRRYLQNVFLKVDRMLRCVEVFSELAVKTFISNEARTSLILGIETLKALSRLGLLAFSKESVMIIDWNKKV